MKSRRGFAPRSNVTFTCPKCKNEHYPLMSALLRNDLRCRECINAKQREWHKRHCDKTRVRPFRHRWTPEEDRLVMATTGAIPGRTLAACRDRRTELGAPLAFTRWSAEEKALIRKLAGKVSTGEIAERYLIGRTTHAIERHCEKHGISLRVAKPKLHRLSERQRALVPQAVEKAVPRTLPAQVRGEVVQSLMLAVLERRVAFADIARQVKPFITKAYAMFPNYGAPISLDAPMFDDGPTTLGDRIESTAFRF